MDACELPYLNAFNAIPGIGPATLRRIRTRFGSFERAWVAADTAFHDLLPQQMRDTTLERRRRMDPERAFELLREHRIWLVTEDDPAFPAALKEIPSPPVALYGRGEATFGKSDQSTCVAVVGTRRPTPYGREATETITHDLASSGITIVSGLATGIDGVAHRAALSAGGATIAVLGCGIDHHTIFPPEHRALARDIIESGGTVISEYAPGTPAMPEHFPQRNRILSGLSRGVIVIEARERSGALITARLALEQNRDVFAVPGPIFSPTSKGPNLLIQEGAKLVMSAADVLQEFGITTMPGEHTIPANMNDDELRIFKFLEMPQSIEAIRSHTRLDAGTIIGALSTLELKGLIRSIDPDTFQRTHYV